MKNIYKFTILGLVTIGVISIFVFMPGKKVSVQNALSSIKPLLGATNTETDPSNQTATTSESHVAQNPITGENCEDGDARPIATMLGADAVARPLYGIAQADLVVEMPVLTNGITRFMALFSCEKPDEIGGMRSARHDFLPFAKSFDAIFSHWGGSHFALDLLHKNVLDNLDAISNSANYFYRKSDRLAPFNGFTSFARLAQAIERLNYRNLSVGQKFIHIQDEPALNLNQVINIKYPFPFNVSFNYSYQANAYTRNRGGEKEIDANNQKQVEVKNLIVMIANSRQLDADYNEVDIEGEGDLLVYRNGEVKKGKWKRTVETYSDDSTQDHKYYFLGEDGKELGFTPGKIWISVVQLNQRVEQVMQ